MSGRCCVAWGGGGGTRAAGARDAFALGTLVREALARAPSAEVAPHELDDDALSLGVHVLGGVAVDVVVAEVDGFLAGLARVERRDFLRSQHIADVQLLVHPAARGNGAGQALLRHVWEAFALGGVYGKLAARVAADDPGSLATFRRAGWVLERTERGALAGAIDRGGRGQGDAAGGEGGGRVDVDVLVLARYAPPPVGVGEPEASDP